MCRLLRNLAALISWNGVGLFRTVMGQLYILPKDNTRVGTLIVATIYLQLI